MYVCVWCNKVYFPNTNPQCDPLAHLGFWVAKYSTTQDVTNVDMRSMHVIIGGNMKFLDVIRTFWVINFQAFKRKQILVREHKQEESNNKVGHVSKQSSQYAVMYNFFLKRSYVANSWRWGGGRGQHWWWGNGGGMRSHPLVSVHLETIHTAPKPMQLFNNSCCIH